MSFILDALRKSEHERRMETAPDIMHAPVAVSRQRLPVWAVFLIGGLAAALVAVSVYSLSVRMRDTNAEVANSAVAPQPAVERVTENERASASSNANSTALTTSESFSAEPPNTTISAAAEAQLLPAADTGSDAVTLEIESSETSAGLPPATASEPATAPAFDPGQLPGYAAVIAEGMNIGTLQMQLHVHSSSPASRFVVVNGSRHREGDRLSAGPLIEEIVAEGAILSYQGRRFLLTPN